MKRRLYTLDVFTTKPFAGNPLAVVIDGDDMTKERMQDVAREMNLSETVFVQKPTNNRALARLRIFTTTMELPLVAATTAMFWFFWRFLDSQRWHWFWASACAGGMAFSCKFTAIVFPPIIGVVWWIAWSHRGKNGPSRLASAASSSASR